MMTGTHEEKVVCTTRQVNNLCMQDNSFELKFTVCAQITKQVKPANSIKYYHSMRRILALYTLNLHFHLPCF